MFLQVLAELGVTHAPINGGCMVDTQAGRPWHYLSAIFVTVIVVFDFTFTINLTTKISQGGSVVRCD